MERLDKIFTILVMAGLIALLVNNYRRPKLMAINTSVAPSAQPGPSYLVSALPISRRNDDYADAVSYYQSGTSLENTWGDGGD